MTRRTLSSLDLKQAGVGLALAVLIGATVIHHVLLPTVMAVLGEGNWYRRGLTRQRGNGATGQRGNGATGQRGNGATVSRSKSVQQARAVKAHNQVNVQLPARPTQRLAVRNRGVTGTTAGLSGGCRFGGAPIDEWVEAGEPRLPAGGR